MHDEEERDEAAVVEWALKHGIHRAVFRQAEIEIFLILSINRCMYCDNFFFSNNKEEIYRLDSLMLACKHKLLMMSEMARLILLAQWFGCDER